MSSTSGAACKAAAAGFAVLLAAATVQAQAPAPGSEAAQVAEITAAYQRRETALLERALSQDDAVDLALLHSPQAIRLAQSLGMSDRDRLSALYRPNPAGQAGAASLPGDQRVNPRLAEETKIQRSQTSHLLSWITPPLFTIQSVAAGATDKADTGAAAAKAAIDRATELRNNAESLGTLVFDVRRAWVQAVAALEARTYYEHVAEAAGVARHLAERMQRIGNYAPLDVIREQRFHADALRDLTRAQLAAALARERLAGLLGLWGPSAEMLQLPSRLPELPPSPVGAESLEALAIAQRVDTQVARIREAADRDEVAVNARTQTRMAWLAYRAAYDLASHARDALVPLAKRAAGEQQRRYNGMLISVFSLIASARDHVAVANAALEAQREFWLTEVDLQQALAGIGAMNPGSRVSAPIMSSDHGPPHTH